MATRKQPTGRKRGRPLGPDIADAFIAVSVGRPTKGAVDRAALLSEDVIKARGFKSVRRYLLWLAEQRPRFPGEFERLKKLRARVGGDYFFSPH